MKKDFVFKKVLKYIHFFNKILLYEKYCSNFYKNINKKINQR